MVRRPPRSICTTTLCPDTTFFLTYCSVITIIVFIVLYWLTDLKGINRWTKLFQPAGSNPLLTYIIPFIMWALYSIFHFYPLPDALRTGIIGIVYRSEEHTSELQSLMRISYAVFCLKNKQKST